jgi:peptidoglycan/LPS O-acetylase OafA/YrhL
MQDMLSARLHGLNSLRALAIGLVMSFHLREFLPQWLQGVSRFGWIGVDLFFVLSGYLIGSQLLRPHTQGRKTRIRDFYRRRFYRVLPAYLVVLLLYLFFPAWREAPGMAPAWMFFTFTWNLVVGWGYAAFSHVWSLCVEEHFYLLLPLIVVALMYKPSLRKAILVASVVLAISVGIRAFVVFHQLRPLGAEGGLFTARYLQTIYWPTYTRLDGLAVGVILASIKLFRPQWWRRAMARGHLLSLGGVACIAVTVLLFGGFFSASVVAALATIIGFLILAVGFGLLLLSSLSNNGLLARVRLPGAKMTALLAYSLYLTHKEIVHVDRLLFPQLTAGGTWTVLIFVTLTCFAVAAVLYFAVERPFLLLRDASDRKRSRAAEERALAEPAL